MPRFPLAPLLVGVLTLFAAGGAVLGAFQAPTSTALTVHNGAGETLQAGHIVGHFTNSQYAGIVIAFDFHAPDHLSEKVVGRSGKVEQQRTVNGRQATAALNPLRRLLAIGTFTQQGSYFEKTLPASVLVRPTTRKKVFGTYRTQVQLEGGYVVGVDIEIKAREGAQHLVETLDYQLSRVDGWSRSH